MHGNGGFGGETPEFGSRSTIRANALKQGFATAQTNTGHDATAEPLATFAVSYQKRVDYAFRAVHMTAVEAKRIDAAYYGRAPSSSYWDRCSTGGPPRRSKAGMIKRVCAGVQVGVKSAFSGQSVGAETAGNSCTGSGTTDRGWGAWLTPPADGKALQHAYGESFVRYFLPRPDPLLDATKFDFSRDIGKYADARVLLNATDPNLGPFRSRGGKLLMYFGWADTALPPLMGV